VSSEAEEPCCDVVATTATAPSPSASRHIPNTCFFERCKVSSYLTSDVRVLFVVAVMLLQLLWVQQTECCHELAERCAPTEGLCHAADATCLLKPIKCLCMPNVCAFLRLHVPCRQIHLLPHKGKQALLKRKGKKGKQPSISLQMYNAGIILRDTHEGGHYSCYAQGHACQDGSDVACSTKRDRLALQLLPVTSQHA
jgi:hypothetical protein